LPGFLRSVPKVLEVSIGHALISDALELGLAEAVRRYLEANPSRRFGPREEDIVILGIGTDLCDVGRIERALERFGERFAERILVPSELERFRRHHKPAAYLAKRFAAKEAFSKALGTGIRFPVNWHGVWVEALHARFKSWCDEYFFLKHRGEPRGVGGIFFDDFAEGGFDRGFALMRGVGDAFLGAYLPIVQRRRALPYGERERDFQAYRRGRYVEFNLVFDRGTLFGLQSGGRTESILMSMPPIVKWRYDWHPRPAPRKRGCTPTFCGRATG